MPGLVHMLRAIPKFQRMKLTYSIADSQYLLPMYYTYLNVEVNYMLCTHLSYISISFVGRWIIVVNISGMFKSGGDLGWR